MLEKLKNRFMLKLNQNQFKPTKRNRIVARIIHSTYRNDILEGAICEFDNPDSSIDLFIAANNTSYLFGPIANITELKKRRKEHWIIDSYLGSVTFEIINKPVKIHINTLNKKHRLSNLFNLKELTNKDTLKQLVATPLRELFTDDKNRITKLEIDTNTDNTFNLDKRLLSNVFNKENAIIVSEYTVI